MFLSSRKTIWDFHPGSRIRIFSPFWIPDPGVKKAPHPGSGSATLINNKPFDENECCGCIFIEFGLGSSFGFRLFRESGSWFPRIQIQVFDDKKYKNHDSGQNCNLFFLLHEGGCIDTHCVRARIQFRLFRGSDLTP
jgi:hypothetical protein